MSAVSSEWPGLRRTGPESTVTRYNSRYSRQRKLTHALQVIEIGGRGRDRTGDPLLAKQMLSQLSYTPTVEVPLILEHLPPFRKSNPPLPGIWSEP